MTRDLPYPGKTLRTRPLIPSVSLLVAGLALVPSAHAAVLPGQPCPPNGGTPLSQFQGAQIKVCFPDELNAKLRAEPPFQGRIVIPRDVAWNLGRFPSEIPVRSNLEIVGERGDLNSRPLLYNDINTASGYQQFVVTGKNVRIEGIHFKGPKLPSLHTKKTAYVDAIGVIAGRGEPARPRRPDRRQRVRQLVGRRRRGDGRARRTCSRPSGTSTPSGSTTTTRTSGSCASSATTCTTTSCTAAATASSSAAAAGRRSRQRLRDEPPRGRRDRERVPGLRRALQLRARGGLQAGVRLEPALRRPRLDARGDEQGLRRHRGHEVRDLPQHDPRRAGLLLRADHRPRQTRPALMLRGNAHRRPRSSTTTCSSTTTRTRRSRSTAGRRATSTSGASCRRASASSISSRAATRTTRTTRARSWRGDFDGDGRTDVFLAAGTGWFISRAGIAPWEFIRALDEDEARPRGRRHRQRRDRRRALPRLERQPRLRQERARGERHAADEPPRADQGPPLRRLRRRPPDSTCSTRRTSSGGSATGARCRAASSTPRPPSRRSSELLFGDFDGIPGTDVAAVKKAGWSYSSGGTGSYTKFNGRLTKSFRGAIVADFDGNGRDDIGFNGDEKWHFARAGRGPARLLRNDAQTPIQNVLFGKFDRSPRAQALTYDSKGTSFIGWDGLGSGHLFKGRSAQKMR